MAQNCEIHRERVDAFNNRVAARDSDPSLKMNHDSPRIKALVKKFASEYDAAKEKFKAKK